MRIITEEFLLLLVKDAIQNLKEIKRGSTPSAIFDYIQRNNKGDIAMERFNKIYEKGIKEGVLFQAADRYKLTAEHRFAKLRVSKVCVATPT